MSLSASSPRRELAVFEGYVDHGVISYDPTRLATGDETVVHHGREFYLRLRVGGVESFQPDDRLVIADQGCCPTDYTGCTALPAHGKIPTHFSITPSPNSVIGWADPPPAGSANCTVVTESISDDTLICGPVVVDRPGKFALCVCDHDQNTPNSCKYPAANDPSFFVEAVSAPPLDPKKVVINGPGPSNEIRCFHSHPCIPNYPKPDFDSAGYDYIQDDDGVNNIAANFGLKVDDMMYVMAETGTCGTTPAVSSGFGAYNSTEGLANPAYVTDVIQYKFEFEGNPSSSGSIFAQHAITAPPDNYTLCYCPASQYDCMANFPSQFLSPGGTVRLGGPTQGQYFTCWEGRQCETNGVQGNLLERGGKMAILSECGTNTPLANLPDDAISANGTNDGMDYEWGSSGDLIDTTPGLYRLCFCTLDDTTIPGQTCTSPTDFKTDAGAMAIGGPTASLNSYTVAFGQEFSIVVRGTELDLSMEGHEYGGKVDSRVDVTPGWDSGCTTAATGYASKVVMLNIQSITGTAPCTDVSYSDPNCFTILETDAPNGISNTDYIRFVVSGHFTDKNQNFRVTQIHNDTFFQIDAQPPTSTATAIAVVVTRARFEGLIISQPGSVTEEQYNLCWIFSSPAQQTSCPLGNDCPLPPIDGLKTAGWVHAGFITATMPLLMTEANLHLTVLEPTKEGPVLLNFLTNVAATPQYTTAVYGMALELRFTALSQLEPLSSDSNPEAVQEEPIATQRECGRFLIETWGQSTGFPMPHSCKWHAVTSGPFGTYQSFIIYFDRYNGLKANTRYELVFNCRTSPSSSIQAGDVLMQVWSKDDQFLKPHEVVEFANVAPDPRRIPPSLSDYTGAVYGSFNATDGVIVLGERPVPGGDFTESDLVELAAVDKLHIKISAGGDTDTTRIKPDYWLEFIFHPLTLWDFGAGCNAYFIKDDFTEVQNVDCTPIQIGSRAAGDGTQNKAGARVTVPGGVGTINDGVDVFVVFDPIIPPAKGFFPEHIGVQVYALGGTLPTHTRSAGGLLYKNVTVTEAGVVQKHGDGNMRPYRGNADNYLYARIVLGSFLFSAKPGQGQMLITLPVGYTCTAAEPTEDLLFVYGSSRPVGVSQLKTDAGDSWSFGSNVCMYTMGQHHMIPSGAPFIVKLKVTNPSTPLPPYDPANVWKIVVRSKGRHEWRDTLEGGDPIQPDMQKIFTGSGDYGPNVAVMGFLTEATLSPSHFAQDFSSNELTVFFKTEQSAGRGAIVELDLLDGFAFVNVDPDVSPVDESNPNITLPPVVSRQAVNGPYCGANMATTCSTRNRLRISLTSSVSLDGGKNYAFKTRRVQNEPRTSYTSLQDTRENAFLIRTYTQLQEAIDGTQYTPRLNPEDATGPSQRSWGVYEREATVFTVDVTNFLPSWYTTTPAAVSVEFEIGVQHTGGKIRVMAPSGYEWDVAVFRYKVGDANPDNNVQLPGITKSLPVVRPSSGVTYGNSLELDVDAGGVIDANVRYAFQTSLHVPGDTPSLKHEYPSANEFFFEYGYDGTLIHERIAAAAFTPARVRRLINAELESWSNAVVRQPSDIVMRVETVTTIPKGGCLRVTLPQNFEVTTGACLGYRTLDSDSGHKFPDDATCDAQDRQIASLPFRNGYIQVRSMLTTFASGVYRFQVQVTNPAEQGVPEGALYVESFSNCDQATDSEGPGGSLWLDAPTYMSPYAVNPKMPAAYIFTETGGYRNDRAEAVNQVTLVFQLATWTLPQGTVDADVMTIVAPEGFVFDEDCGPVNTAAPFRNYAGAGKVEWGLTVFPLGVTVASCQGADKVARLTILGGDLSTGLNYVFTIRVNNPATTPDPNMWSLSYRQSSAEPFAGFDIWAFSDVVIVPTTLARSTALGDTINDLCITLAPYQDIITGEAFLPCLGTPCVLSSGGVLRITAPSGFLFSTICTLHVTELTEAGLPVKDFAGDELMCEGTNPPNSFVRVRVLKEDTRIEGGKRYQIFLSVINPQQIVPVPERWYFLSCTAESNLGTSCPESNRLDAAYGDGFRINDVMDTFSYVTPSSQRGLREVPLQFTLEFPDDVLPSDSIHVIAPVSFNFGIGQSTLCRNYTELTVPPVLPTDSDNPVSPNPECTLNEIAFVIGQQIPEATTISFSVGALNPMETPSPNNFEARHYRNDVIQSSALAAGYNIVPQLIDPLITPDETDARFAAGSTTKVSVSFTTISAADTLVIQSPHLSFSRVKVTGGKYYKKRTDTVDVRVDMGAGEFVMLTLENLKNPDSPVAMTLWTIMTYLTDVEGNRAKVDEAADVECYPVYGLLTIVSGDMTDSFYGSRNNTITLTLRAEVPASKGEYILVDAPFGFEILDYYSSDTAGAGRNTPPGRDWGNDWGQNATAERFYIELGHSWSGYAMTFSLVANNPDRSYLDNRWTIMTSKDRNGTQITNTNDGLFPEFGLLGFFLDVRVDPSSRSPSAPDVVVEMAFSLSHTIVGEANEIKLTVRMPDGFVADTQCLADSELAGVFGECLGAADIATLTTPLTALQASTTYTTAMKVTNAIAIGEGEDANSWQLEISVAGVIVAKSVIEGYVVSTVDATVTGSSPVGRPTQAIFVFSSSMDLPPQGRIDVNSPTGYFLSCADIDMGNLPTGTECFPHEELPTILLLEMDSRNGTLANTTYIFALSTMNPSIQPTPNLWGLTLKAAKSGSVIDANLNIQGWQLSRFDLSLGAMRASSNVPSQRNTLELSWQMGTIESGVGNSIRIRCSEDFRLSQDVCESLQFSITGFRTVLRPDPAKAPECNDDKLIVHLDPSVEFAGGEYAMRLTITNPASSRSDIDVWHLVIYMLNYQVASVPFTFDVFDQDAFIGPSLAERVARPSVRLFVLLWAYLVYLVLSYCVEDVVVKKRRTSGRCVLMGVHEQRTRA
ncbi:unnamed protein product [Vitrella brassicaformis CCMP3155]|uniref:Protein arginine methyltransferase 10 n=3 Tax=Vitrella brassicaformis TaxID=1169539 RepID=A0A0G4G3K4_VITBC|nr:unnamed protein product [Vitrella brassicaformis CCMP3155]|eukprot:CEM22531.1 unnamed protein product [Vitrella brassicaformis CCMP3155]